MPPQKTGRGAKSDLPQDDLTKADLTLDTSDVDPESSAAEEDDEARLPEASEDGAEPVAEGTLSVGHAAIENAVRLAPTSPCRPRSWPTTSTGGDSCPACAC